VGGTVNLETIGILVATLLDEAIIVSGGHWRRRHTYG
jgi:hypothetical protein